MGIRRKPESKVGRRVEIELKYEGLASTADAKEEQCWYIYIDRAGNRYVYYGYPRNSQYFTDFSAKTLENTDKYYWCKVTMIPGRDIAGYRRFIRPFVIEN